jgi:uncharacterized protein YecT (DUF1311 family)
MNGAGIARLLAKSLLAALLCISWAARASDQYPASNSTQWLLSYKGKSTNDFARDQREAYLVRTRIPAKLSSDLLSALGGPPDPVFVVDQRYVSVSACVPHDCQEKGFLWMDTKTGISLGAYSAPDTLLLGSNEMSPDHIPSAARRALIDWLSEYDLRSASVAFIGSAGTRTALDPSTFKPRDKFQAPTNGPAFDCALASNQVEKTICHDAELSKLDLALTALVNEIRRATATTTAQEQLIALQRKWQKDRDVGCAVASEMSTCLKARYQAQHERLMNWVPKG